MYISDLFYNIFLILAMIVVVPPLAFTAGVINLTDKIVDVRDKVAGFLGFDDLYY